MTQFMAPAPGWEWDSAIKFAKSVRESTRRQYSDEGGVHALVSRLGPKFGW